MNLNGLLLPLLLLSVVAQGHERAHDDRDRIDPIPNNEIHINTTHLSVVVNMNGGNLDEQNPARDYFQEDPVVGNKELIEEIAPINESVALSVVGLVLAFFLYHGGKKLDQSDAKCKQGQKVSYQVAEDGIAAWNAQWKIYADDGRRRKELKRRLSVLPKQIGLAGLRHGLGCCEI